jgi:hypothetical protein
MHILADVAPSTAAGIITATATLFTAIGGLIIAFGVLWPILKATRTTIVQSAATAKKVDDVHTLVNQQHTDLQRYQVALLTALRNAGIDIPVDQSLPVVETPGPAHIP